jgi:hypothetical protein
LIEKTSGKDTPHFLILLRKPWGDGDVDLPEHTFYGVKREFFLKKIQEHEREQYDHNFIQKLFEGLL